MKELKEKGFIEEGVIHSKSIKPLSEIRKKKRKSETRKSDNEIREDNSEIHSRNNINNNTKNNIKSFPNTSVVKAQRPKDERIKPSQSEDNFVF